MKKFLVLVVMLCAVLISSTASAEADWIKVGSDKYITVWVDSNSISLDRNYYTNYIIRASVKIVYTDEGRQREIERYRSNGKPLPKEIYNLSHDIDLFCFKDATDSIKCFDCLKQVSYTHNGATIPDMSFSRRKPKWTIILPDTIIEKIFDSIITRISK